ncbi:Uncharacterised protein [Bordetella pertussis]|nr:Uncharacterised protein [Bordetella pertussis]
MAYARFSKTCPRRSTPTWTCAPPSWRPRRTRWTTR